MLKEELEADANPETERSKRAAKVWPLLERNEIESALYPEEIVHYAIMVLINNGYEEDARTLFERYLNVSRQSTEDAFIPSEHIDELALWECEVAAWFNLQDGNVLSAMALYNSIIDKYSLRSPVMNVSGQNDSVVMAYINMGNIYAGMGQNTLALEYLAKASSRVLDSKIKAEILYRMGKASYYGTDYRSAIRSLQYSLKLNPSHNKARLMLQLVQQAQNMAK